MKSIYYTLSSTVVLGLGLCSASSGLAKTVIENGDIVFEDHLYKVLDKDSVKITFEEGSTTLSKESLKDLANFEKTTNGEAKVDQYIVATWADKDYPEKGELSGSQRKLAITRSHHIKKALSADGATEIRTFEMTKQPNWIQRAFRTETAEIQNKDVAVTEDAQLLKEIGQKLRDKGGPRTAVVIAKFKNEVLSE